ncbi:hypothetical protein BGW38_007655 [Lunasporangiospora selenospora]|uniref:Kelch motif-containing protein n=1 Tax=Lunasporangiospora selenospora TaxID=979761 RepID=A0A9P6KA86_9FUNG|nr:hypothetical protein BGW38_007655 [Lunasporangiospora selenospora]
MIAKKPVVNLAWLSVLVTVVPSFLNAQGYIPHFTWICASAFEEGKAFYIKGGLSTRNREAGQAQMFSIDLSFPWETSSVPYKEIEGSGPDKLTSATLTKDSKKLVFFGETISKEYDIERGTWRDIPAIVDDYYHRAWSRAMNPSTGKIYAIDGYNPYFQDFLPLQMHEYDPSNGAVQTILMTPSFDRPFTDVQALWNPLTDKLAMFVKEAFKPRYEFFRTWDQIIGWSETITKGAPPFDRINGCIEQAYNGTKLILFGGFVPGRYLDDIYIFDIATATWTQGTSAGAGNGRLGAACAVANDLFITWGGRTMEGELSSDPILIYNLKTDAWQTNYTPFRTPDPIESETTTTFPSPTEIITTDLSSTGINTVTPSPTGSTTVSSIENTSLPAPTTVNTATSMPTEQSSLVTPSNESQRPSPSSNARQPSLNDEDMSQPLPEENLREDGHPGGRESEPKSKILGPVVGATLGGIVAIFSTVGLFVLLRRRELQKGSRRKGHSPWSSTENLIQEDLSFSLEPVSISYSVRDIQPCEQESLPISDRRGPQSVAHEWSSQFQMFDLHTLRHPEDTSESRTADASTVHADLLKNACNFQERSSHEGTLPEHHPTISGVTRDPQHPRGYGDCKPMNSQSEESSLSWINTIQADQVASLTVCDSGAMLVGDNAQDPDENNSKADIKT